MSKRLAGKVAIVTGAGCVGPGWGNGRAIATRFAQEGARIFAVDKSMSAMEETLDRIQQDGGDVTPYEADVTDPTAITELVHACMQKYDVVDVLVNNVGAPSPGGLLELTEADWRTQLDVNLTSMFLMCKYAVPAMLNKGSGAIVNVASTSGIRWTGAAQIGYATAKGGVIQFGRVLAVELAKQRIRVNTVVPGQMHTPMVEAVIAKNQSGGDVDAILARRQKRIPLPFMGDGRDVANAVLFLASDEARFITGTELVVDGGMSVRCD